MNIKVYINNQLFDYKRFVFPGGEVGVKFERDYRNKEFLVNIIARIQNSEDFICLAMVKDALFNQGYRKFDLLMPYIPYSRQDRICDFGESFSLKVFINMLNSLKFDNVTVLMSHFIG
jgi:ribose-phosphate pyrophosphokinase